MTSKLEWHIDRGWTDNPKWSLRLYEDDDGKRDEVLDLPFENRHEAENALAKIARAVLDNVKSRSINVDALRYHGDFKQGIGVITKLDEIDIYNPGRDFRGKPGT